MTHAGSERTLGDLIERNAWLYPDKAAIVFEERTLTFGALLTRARKLANALLARGLTRGSRIAALAQNCPEYMELFAAVELTGLTIVNLNWRLTPAELVPILQDCQPDVLFCEAQFAEKAAALKAHLGGAQQIVVIAGEHEGAMPYEGFMGSAPSDAPTLRARGDDTAYLIYTSGTTGKPKGVMLGNAAMLQAATTISLDSGARPKDRMMIVMPLFHIGARIEYLAFAAVGATIHLHRQFDTNAVIDCLARDRITVAHLAPTMVQLILDAPALEGRDLSALRLVHYASAPMNVTLLRRAIARFGNIFMQLYGMTEAVVGTILHPHQHVLDGDDSIVRRLASAGQPFSTTTIRVARPDNSDCAPEEIGEILISCAGNMKGYWNNTALQIDVLRDGFMRTGDMGFFDREGFLFIADRKKDMIVSGGENIYSREVEEALLTHPAVTEAAVIGVPDDKWGEAVKACVVLRSAASASEADLIAHVRDQIASYKKPKSIDVVDTLPRLFNGKIDKKVLREPYWASRDRRV